MVVVCRGIYLCGGVTVTLIYHLVKRFAHPPGCVNTCCAAQERFAYSFRSWHVQGTNGQSAESFRFAIRKQLTSHLCMRRPNKHSGKQATKRGYGATTHAEGDSDDEFGFVTLVSIPPRANLCLLMLRGLVCSHPSSSSSSRAPPAW